MTMSVIDVSDSDARTVLATQVFHEVCVMSDPLLQLIQTYRSEFARYNAELPDNASNEEADRFADATFNPPFERLLYDPPAPTTREGALEGIRVVIEEAKTCSVPDELITGVLAYSLAFLEAEGAVTTGRGGRELPGLTTTARTTTELRS